MSLQLDTTEVEAVLLADGWYEIESDSFYIDDFDLCTFGDMRGDYQSFVTDYSGGAGFSFRAHDGARFSGPMSSVLAIRFPKRTDA